MVDGFDTTILLLPLTAILLGCLAAVWRMLPERADRPSRVVLTVLADGRIVGRVVPAARDDLASGQSLADGPWTWHAATENFAGGLRGVLSHVWRSRRAESRCAPRVAASNSRAGMAAARDQGGGPDSSSPTASTSGHVRLRRLTADAPAGEITPADQASAFDTPRAPADDGLGAGFRTS